MIPFHSAPMRCVLLAALLGFSTQIRADDAPQSVALLSVEVTAVESGQILHGARCGLQRAGARRGYARFAGPDYRGKLAIQDGDLLHVYVRGRDLARLPLTKGQRSAKVALKLATRQCAVKLEGADMRGVRSRLTWWIEPSGNWNRAGPFTERIDQSIVGATARHVVPAGADIFVTVESEGAIVWPRMAPARFHGGARKARNSDHEEGGKNRQDEAESGENSDAQPEGIATLHVDRPWRPVVRLPANSGVPVVNLFPDYRVPAPGPPSRNDAWRWAVAEPLWGQDSGGQDSGGLRNGAPNAIAPAVPFHIVVTCGQVTLVRHIRPEGPTLDLSTIPPHRALRVLPLVDGQPVPIGTSILPGRLDLATVGGFLDVAMSHARLAIEVNRRVVEGLVAEGRVAEGRERAWAMQLPASDWLTIWHPKTGMAHLRWKPGERPTGKRYRGGLLVRAPKGWVMDGKISAFSDWKGTRRVNTTPPLGNLGRAVENAPSVRYRGLPSGWYTFIFDFELLEPATGRRHVVKHRIQRKIVANDPHATYQLRAPR